MDWFEHWFNEDYLLVYGHRSREQARDEAELVGRACELGPTDRLLDIGCGAARHLEWLAPRVALGIGVDLSAALLSAGKRAVSSARLVQGDMRTLPFADESFTVLTSLFTAFGYFSDESVHSSLLDEWRRILAPGGRLFLDFLNATQARNQLGETTREVSGNRIVERRSISPDGRRLEKSIRLEGASGPREYFESVRLFSPSELRGLLEDAAFRVEREAGNFDGSPLEASSPRAIFVCRKKERFT